MIDPRILPSGVEDMQEASAYSISRRMSPLFWKEL